MTPQQLVKEILDPILAKEGYSTYFAAVKIQLKRRLQIDKSKRPDPVHATPAEKVKLYNRQGGWCPWRNPDKDNPHMLTVPISRNEADHINVNIEGDAYNSLKNKQLLCKDCNRQKSAMTIQEQAVHQGKTFEEITRVPVEAEV